MKGLKIIPLFVGLIVLSYLGVVFVEANRTDVVISFGNYQSAQTAVGFVVLTSVLFGMILAGFLCAIEIMVLFLQVKKLRRRIVLYEEGKIKATNIKPESDRSTAKREVFPGGMG